MTPDPGCREDDGAPPGARAVDDPAILRPLAGSGVGEAPIGRAVGYPTGLVLAAADIRSGAATLPLGEVAGA